MLPMTEEDRNIILADIRNLQDQRRGVLDQVSETARGGNRTFDADYHQTRALLASIDARLSRLNMRLAGSCVVEPHETPKNPVAGFGMTVSYRNSNGRDGKVTLVGPEDADPANGRINAASPLGRALIGRKAGEKADVSTPGGDYEVEILAIA